MRRHPFRVARLVALLAAAALIVTACAGPSASGNVSQGPAGGDAIAIKAEDNDFVPARIEAPAGTEITVEVTNVGLRDHNFTISSLDLSTGTMSPGDVVTATFTVPEGGVEFACTFHRGMTGQIVPT